MIFLKPYIDIPNFLQRFTILKIGKLHIRIHKLLSEDKTTLFHNHPFNYCSIIFKGGYNESYLVNGNIIKVKHKAPAIIIRKHNVQHRIESIEENTLTLFLTYGKYKWSAINTSERKHSDGIFRKEVNNKLLWCKRENDIWFIGNESKEIAMLETRHSIFQYRE